MTDAKLKSLSDRINRLLDEKKAIGDDIADIFQEAKGVGYVPKVLRKVIMRARADQTKLAEEDSLQELYEAALDAPTRKALAMAAQGATSRQIEAETGLDHVTVSRSVSLKKKTETQEVDVLGDDAGHRSEPSSPAEQSVNAGPPSAQAGLTCNSQGEQSGTHSETEVLAVPPGGGTGTDVTSIPAPAAATFDEIAGEMPAHLRRVPA